MDAHNVPGAAEVIRPIRFGGGKIDRSTLSLVVPAKSVVVLKLNGNRNKEF
jgi:alpha-L-arabinofuranosidase